MCVFASDPIRSAIVRREQHPHRAAPALRTAQRLAPHLFCQCSLGSPALPELIHVCPSHVHTRTNAYLRVTASALFDSASPHPLRFPPPERQSNAALALYADRRLRVQAAFACRSPLRIPGTHALSALFRSRLPSSETPATASLDPRRRTHPRQWSPPPPPPSPTRASRALASDLISFPSHPPPHSPPRSSAHLFCSVRNCVDWFLRAFLFSFVCTQHRASC